MKTVRKVIRDLWVTFVLWVGHIPYVTRLVELAREHSVESSEGWSIICAIGWFLPTLINPRYLTTSPYLLSIAAYIPRWLMLVGMGSLSTYQLLALLLVPEPAKGDSLHEHIRATTARTRWYRARANGLLFGIFIWATLAFMLSLHGLSTGTVIFGSLAIGCAVGQYIVGELSAKTEQDWQAYLVITEQAELMAAAIKAPSTPSTQTKAPA